MNTAMRPAVKTVHTPVNTPERHWQECVKSQVGVMSHALRSGDVYTVVEKSVRVSE